MTNRADFWMIAVSLFIAIAGFAVYRWSRRNRVERIKAWIREYLWTRYGELPVPLQINCTDDPLWPVLVAFNHPRSGIGLRLQFSCARAPTSYTLTSEKEAPR